MRIPFFPGFLRRSRRPRSPQSTPLATVDYRPAVSRIIAQLGDRYLLAKPINRRG